MPLCWTSTSFARHLRSIGLRCWSGYRLRSQLGKKLLREYEGVFIWGLPACSMFTEENQGIGRMEGIQLALGRPYRTGRPCSIAAATACEREVTSSLEKMLARWNLTVRSVTPKIWPTSQFVLPFFIQLRMVTSRGDSSLTQFPVAGAFFRAVLMRARWRWRPRYSTSCAYRSALMPSPPAKE